MTVDTSMSKKSRSPSSPPPYLPSNVNADISLTVYASTALQPTASSSSHIANVLHLTSTSSGITRYSIEIPKKREGWKAQVSSVSEKNRQEVSLVFHPIILKSKPEFLLSSLPFYQLRYEVRREPLARRYDFRDPEGNHNVMIPHLQVSQKSYHIETQDGQKLMWRRNHEGWELLSLPSQTILARYGMFTSGSRNEPGFRALGSLEVMNLPMEDMSPMPLQKDNRASTISSSSSSSTSSEGPPRLGRAYQRCSIGLCVPGAICASIGSPYISADMSRSSIIGDELINLGRGIIKAVLKRSGSSEFQRAGNNWLQMNQSNPVKNNDPRPRRVDMDLIVSTFVAVLAG